VDSPDSPTPLIHAVTSFDHDNKYEMVRLLLAGGANASAPDFQGRLLLSYVHPGNQKMRALLTNGLGDS